MPAALSRSGSSALGALVALAALGPAGSPRPSAAPCCPSLEAVCRRWRSKRISPDRLVGRTNWNTDFAVDRTFNSYRVNFQSVSTGRGTFPLAVFLRFSDGSNLQVVNQNLTLDPQQNHPFGSFPAVAGKRTSKVNVRLGPSQHPGSTGFSYRVSVEGCN